MNKLKKLLDRKTNWILVLTATVIFALFIAVVLPRVSAYTEEAVGGKGSPDTDMMYTGQDLYEIAESYGEDGRSTYILLRWTFDVVWPLVYTFFILSMIIWIGKFVTYKWVHSIYYLPILAMLFDYLENILVTIVMISFPKKLIGLGQVASYASMTKWVVLSLAFIGIVVVLLARIIEFMTKNRGNGDAV